MALFKHNAPHEAGHCVLVAGAGVEPTPSGYEPDEVPFLYPAAGHSIQKQRSRQTADNRA